MVDRTALRTRSACAHMQIGHGEQDRQKDVSACVLALAMLASSCRLADIAASEELVEKVPLFVKASHKLSI